MRVAIRADASTWIGTGHVTRCATLAGALRERGAEILFVCRSLPGDCCSWLERQGYAVCRLEAVAGKPPGVTTPVAWLDVKPEREMADMAAVLVERGPFDWLVADHYALGAEWERVMRPYCRRILAIDDLADRTHDCDLLLDQNLVAGMDMRYSDLAPVFCRQLLGPRYALLQPAYADWHQRVTLRSGSVRRLLVFFGGADAANLTAKALAALGRLGRRNLRVDVVVGGSNPHRHEVVRMAAVMPGVSLHENLTTLAPLMAVADLALGASGATSWERCCLGLPALVVTLAENQIPVARELDARGLVRWLGDATEVDETVLAAALGDILARDIPESWSQGCRELVDGAGTRRVVAAMEADADMPLIVRDIVPRDEDLLLEWANDPFVRRNAFCSNRIERAGHQGWFRARLRERGSCRIHVVETDSGFPVGQVRFDRRDDDWLIGYSMDVLFRGVGLGKRLLGAAIARHVGEIGSCLLVGRVKRDNPISCRVFERLGFAATDDGEDVVEYRLAADQCQYGTIAPL